ncbi:MAG: hypothetical protein QGG40_17685, partial [Myxococcota bacterium]|nr:hypothetical protein [Myxococcota bacterium]
PGGVPGGHKYVTHFLDDWLTAQMQWTRRIYDRVNPHTGLHYAEDPAIALVEITNENSLVAGWLGGSLERLPESHRRALDERWNAWLSDRYGSDEALAAAWSGGDRAGLALGESLSFGSVGRHPVQRWMTPLWPMGRVEDLWTFYSELEDAYLTQMRAFLQEELGFDVPLTGTIAFGRGHADMLQGTSDFVDVHFEWDQATHRRDLRNISALQDPAAFRILERIGWGQEGIPLTFSELNHPHPNRHGAEAPILWATLGRKQGIDAIVWFAYAHGGYERTPQEIEGIFDLRARTGLWIQMPTASALFRSSSLEEADGRYVYWRSRGALVDELARFGTPAVAQFRDVDFALRNRLRSSFADGPQGQKLGDASTDSGWWTSPGVLLVQTEQVEGIVGELGMEPQDLEHGGGLRTLEHLQVRSSGHGAVHLQALDEQAVGESRDLLLVAVGRTGNAGETWSGGDRAILTWGTDPVAVERLVGEIWFRTKGRPVVHSLGERGLPLERVSVRRRWNGWWSIDMQDGAPSPWFRIQVP